VLKPGLLMDLDRYFEVFGKIQPEDKALLSLDAFISDFRNTGTDTDDRQAALNFSDTFMFLDKDTCSSLIQASRQTPPIAFKKMEANQVRDEIRSIAVNSYETEFEILIGGLQTLANEYQPKMFLEHSMSLKDTQDNPIKSSVGRAMNLYTKALIISVAQGPGKQNIYDVMRTEYPEIKSGKVNLMDVKECRKYLLDTLEGSGMEAHQANKIIGDYETAFLTVVRKEMGIPSSLSPHMQKWIGKRDITEDDLHFLCEYTADLINFVTGISSADAALDGHTGRDKAGLIMDLDRWFAIYEKMQPHEQASIHLHMLLSDPAFLQNDSKETWVLADDFALKFGQIISDEQMAALAQAIKPGVKIVAERSASLETQLDWMNLLQYYQPPEAKTTALYKRATPDLVLDMMSELAAISVNDSHEDKIITAAANQQIFSLTGHELSLREIIGMESGKKERLERAHKDFGFALLMQMVPDAGKPAIQAALQRRFPRLTAEYLDYDTRREEYHEAMVGTGVDKVSAGVMIETYQKNYNAQLQRILGIKPGRTRVN
jgi:hypothetical protein